MSDFRENVRSSYGETSGTALFAVQNPSRDDVAAYVLSNRDVIRRRVCRKLRQAGLWTDPDDVTSSVIRRIDMAFLKGILRTQSDREFWAYVLAITENVTITRLRKARIDRTFENSHAPPISMLAQPIVQCEKDDDAMLTLHHAMMTLRHDSDRELLLWKLSGMSYASISASMGKSEPAIRTQWAKICRILRAHFARGVLGHPNSAHANERPT